MCCSLASLAGSTTSAKTNTTTTYEMMPKGGTLIPNRIFVGGLTSSTSEDELRSYFATFGLVKDVKIIHDRPGLSKGSYGFVTFDKQETAEAIIKNQLSSDLFHQHQSHLMNRQGGVNATRWPSSVTDLPGVGAGGGGALILTHPSSCPLSNKFPVSEGCPHKRHSSSNIPFNQSTVCYPATIVVPRDVAIGLSHCGCFCRVESSCSTNRPSWVTSASADSSSVATDQHQPDELNENRSEVVVSTPINTTTSSPWQTDCDCHSNDTVLSPSNNNRLPDPSTAANSPVTFPTTTTIDPLRLNGTKSSQVEFWSNDDDTIALQRQQPLPTFDWSFEQHSPSSQCTQPGKKIWNEWRPFEKSYNKQFTGNDSWLKSPPISAVQCAKEHNCSQIRLFDQLLPVQIPVCSPMSIANTLPDQPSYNSHNPNQFCHGNSHALLPCCSSCQGNSDIFHSNHHQHNHQYELGQSWTGLCVAGQSESPSQPRQPFHYPTKTNVSVNCELSQLTQPNNDGPTNACSLSRFTPTNLNCRQSQATNISKHRTIDSMGVNYSTVPLFDHPPVGVNRFNRSPTNYSSNKTTMMPSEFRLSPCELIQLPAMLDQLVSNNIDNDSRIKIHLGDSSCIVGGVGDFGATACGDSEFGKDDRR